MIMLALVDKGLRFALQRIKGVGFVGGLSKNFGPGGASFATPQWQILGGKGEWGFPLIGPVHGKYLGRPYSGWSDILSTWTSISQLGVLWPQLAICKNKCTWNEYTCPDTYHKSFLLRCLECTSGISVFLHNLVIHSSSHNITCTLSLIIPSIRVTYPLL